MSTKYILIVLGEPYSTFSEIIGKYFTNIKIFKKKIIIIGDANLLKKQLNKLNYQITLNQIEDIKYAKKNLVNIINVEFKHKRIFSKISGASNVYIDSCFKKSLEIINLNKNKIILINGPISKKSFLKKKFLGITEFLSKNTNSKNEVMLIYNKKLSVSPLTTHIPIKFINKKIKKNKIYNNIIMISLFYKEYLKIKPKIAVLGLNPHCETTDKYSEEEKIIVPSIKHLKKKRFNIDGPFSADTFFLKKNINKYNIVIGMYHDQVLTPIKTLFNFEAINITLGLPFIRISPDHGPNAEMLGKNKSDPSSFFYAMKFSNNLK